MLTKNYAEILKLFPRTMINRFSVNFSVLLTDLKPHKIHWPRPKMQSFILRSKKQQTKRELIKSDWNSLCVSKSPVEVFRLKRAEIN